MSEATSVFERPRKERGDSFRVPKSSRPGAKMPAMEAQKARAYAGDPLVPSQGSAFQPVRTQRRLPTAPGAGVRGDAMEGRMSKLLRSRDARVLARVLL